MKSNSIDAATVRDLRNISGCGIVDCKEALEACNGDYELAIGYLKYKGCAVIIGDGSKEAYNEWLMKSAEAYKKSLLC